MGALKDELTRTVHVVEIDPNLEALSEKELVDFVGELLVGVAVGDHHIVPIGSITRCNTIALRWSNAELLAIGANGQLVVSSSIFRIRYVALVLSRDLF